MAHVRQSRPDSGLGFQVKAIESFQVVPFSLGSEQGVRGGGTNVSAPYICPADNFPCLVQSTGVLGTPAEPQVLLIYS